jgi:hypothetical protein
MDDHPELKSGNMNRRLRNMIGAGGANGEGVKGEVAGKLVKRECLRYYCHESESEVCDERGKIVSA